METWYLQVLSGKRSDPLSWLIWIALWFASWFYWIGVSTRNFGYRVGLFKSTESTLPIISVGNLSTGGTGKTPTVAFLVEHFFASNQKPAVVARGYGARDGELNDEGKLLQLFEPRLKQFQNPNRRASVATAETQDIDVIILDDGFQHRKLARDFELLLIDATNPDAYGYLLPAGLLRDTFGQLSRADAIMITRANQVEAMSLTQTRLRLERYSDAPIFVSEFRPSSFLKLPSYETVGVSELGQREVMAISGIGNPTAFYNSLEGIGLTLKSVQSFPDHHLFSEQDLNEILEELRRQDLKTLIMTDKDAVKLAPLFSTAKIGEIEAFVLRIELKLENADDLMKLIQESVEQKRGSRPNN